MQLSDFKHRVTYSTKLSADVIYSRLLSVTTPYATLTSVFNSEYLSKKYVGDIASEGFVLNGKGSSAAWAPEVRGRFEFKDTTSLIHLQLSPHPIGMLLGLLIPTLIFLPVSISIIRDETLKPVFNIHTLWFLAFSILYPVGVIASYLHNTYRMQKHLKELLEADEVTT